MPVRPQLQTSVFTQSNHVFQILPHPLMVGIRKPMTDLIQDVARCICPYHLNPRLWTNAVMSSMPISVVVELRGFCLGLWCHKSSGSCCGLQVSGVRCRHFAPWSMAEETQAVYTLPCMLGERCLVVRTGKSFLNFSHATQHLVAVALSQSPPEHNIPPSMVTSISASVTGLSC